MYIGVVSCIHMYRGFMYIHTYTYIYIYMYMYVYTYMYALLHMGDAHDVQVCMEDLCIYIHIYVYIWINRRINRLPRS